MSCGQGRSASTRVASHASQAPPQHLKPANGHARNTERFFFLLSKRACRGKLREQFLLTQPRASAEAHAYQPPAFIRREHVPPRQQRTLKESSGSSGALELHKHTARFQAAAERNARTCTVHMARLPASVP
jgi:hypothetical protein